MDELRVALLWSGDSEERRTATLETSRLAGVAVALRDAGLDVRPAVYNDDLRDEVFDQLVDVEAVLVWVNPGERGRDRDQLDVMLRDVAGAGVLVSAHPETIRKIGTKEILYRTRNHGFGSDTRLYADQEQMRRELPRLLAEGQARVLKQSRGNGGNGVWKVEGFGDEELGDPAARLRVRHAARGAVEQVLTFDELMALMIPAFLDGGSVVDQVYQPRLVEGMIRCYLVGDQVVGFGEQLVNALYPAPEGASPEEAPLPGPRLYYPPTRADLQGLKESLETVWLPQLCGSESLDVDEFPLLWDADFLRGPEFAEDQPDYVLCEINVSSVFPFPEEALQPLADELVRKLTIRRL